MAAEPRDLIELLDLWRQLNELADESAIGGVRLAESNEVPWSWAVVDTPDPTLHEGAW